MKRYLEGYLASIPESDYQAMIASLAQLGASVGLSETQIEQGLAELRTQYKPLTPDLECRALETPADSCDRVFPYLQIDISYLYKLIDLLDIAIRRYRDLSLSNLKKTRLEIDLLRIELEKRKKINQSDSGSTVITEEFSDTRYMEVMDASNGYLFRDRDGSRLPAAQIIRRNAEEMLTLDAIRDRDMLHTESGIGKGRIDILDVRGIPEPTIHGRANAIDGSSDTYWELVCNESRPLLSPMNAFPAGGAYLRFRLTMAKMMTASEISITPYCSHPVDVVELLLDGKNILSRETSSVGSMTFQFPRQSVREIIITLRQKNYLPIQVKNNPKILEAETIWQEQIGTPFETLFGDRNTADHFIRSHEESVDVLAKLLIREREDLE